MARISNRTLALALALSASGAAATAFADPNAFPGAQGFGADATGGRTGSIDVVTNLNDSGAGSFRDAVSASNRIIVFAVSGQINLASAISAKSNLTILGQTAPGQGITVQGHELSFDSQSNDIVQYIRAREGAEDTSAKASINLGSTTNFIVDHVSAEYSQYDNIDAVGTNGVANLTVQNSMLADPIHAQYFNMHTEGTNVTYLANLWANSGGRNPLAKSNSQFVNNTVYNYGYAYTTGNSAGVFNYDILNNYFITGSITNTASDTWFQLDSNQSAYASGNFLDSNKDGTLNGSATTPSGLNLLSSEYFGSTKFLPTLTAAQSYALTTAHAGSMFNNGNGTFGRDEVDSQIVSQVESLGTAGARYNAEKDTGNSNNGWGADVIGASPANTLDTVPFAWLTAHGLSTTNAADLLKKNAVGYTMIEQYAYEVADQYASQTWTNSSGSWVSGTWNGATPTSYDHAYILGNGVTNGSATISGSDSATAFSLNIGGNGPAAGESLTVSGGSLNVQGILTIGDQNNASLNISGGSVFAYNVQLGNTVRDLNGNITANYTGNLSLTGGTLSVQEIVYGAGNYGAWNSGGTFTWSNATLQAVGNLAINIPVATAGNITFDSNAFNGTYSGVISGTGNLTKISAGNLTLSANNTFSGNTTISAGAIRASNNNAFGTGTINVNTGSGLVLSNGITISSKIVAATGSSEFEDVPDASASATIAGNVTVGGGSNQYRLGVSGTNAILHMTGASTTSGIALITRGNIIFAGTGSLINTSQAVTIGRSSSTSTLTFIVQDNALVQGNGIALGGLNGSSDDITTTVNLNGNGTISSGTAPFNLNNSATGGAVTLNLNGTSLLKAGSFATSGSNQGQTNFSFNGGTLQATAGDSATPFFPALGTVAKPLAATINAAGLTVNDGGFNITFAQPLSGSGPLTKTGAGTLTLAAAEPFTGPITVNAGTLTFTPAATIASSNITIASGAALNIPASTNLPTAASLTANGTVSLAAPVKISSLSLGGASNAWTGSVNLAGNKLILEATPATKSTALAQLQNQAAYGATNSTGIDSSALPAGFAIAVLDNAVTQLTTFGGLPVDANSLLVAPELLGDTNADSHVDLSDLSTVLNNFGTTTAAWTSGNFDNAATIDLTDLSAILNNFGLTNPNASTAGFTVAAPEPASLALLLPAACLLARKRRHS